MATAEALTAAPPRRDPSPRLWTDAEFARMQELGVFGTRDIELRGGVVFDRAAGRPFVFTRKEYYALGDNHFFHGVVRDQRVQLIGGVILQEVVPMNPPHATAVRKTARAMDRLFVDGYEVRPQLPLDLGPISEPHPDVAVVVGSVEDFATQHPTSAVLVIEVADSTIEADTHDKASLYAAGGIEDYWVVDLTRDQVVVFRSPRPEVGTKFGSHYGAVTAHGRDDTLTPLAAPTARVAVADLLP
jgi:Uma2 family endonuclease